MTYKDPAQERTIAAVITELQTMSEQAGDNLFNQRFEFLQHLEQNVGHGAHIDGELYHEWQMRRNNSMTDMLFEFFKWEQQTLGTASEITDTLDMKRRFNEWLKGIYQWYYSLVNGGALLGEIAFMPKDAWKPTKTKETPWDPRTTQAGYNQPALNPWA